MRKMIVLFFCGVLLSSPWLRAGDLYWYLGAAMSKPGKEVVSAFNRSKRSYRVFLILGGSGQLLSQISSSRKGDIYTPASTAFKDKAVSLGLVRNSWELLSQTPVFGLSRRGAARISDFSSLRRKGVRIALGNPKTMALGSTYLEIEKKMEIRMVSGIRRNSIVEALNISQIVSYLKTGIADAGLIFDTVARANGFEVVEIPDEVNVRETAHFILLTLSRNREAVDAFRRFVFDQRGIFSKFGFTLIEKRP